MREREREGERERREMGVMSLPSGVVKMIVTALVVVLAGIGMQQLAETDVGKEYMKVVMDYVETLPFLVPASGR